MALFHLNVSSISKSSGSSVVAAAAYRSCSELNQYFYDTTRGILSAFTHNYSNKKGLAFSYIFAPNNLDEWCYNRQSLWNKVEESETRKDARFARDIKVALQKEFTLEQNIQILSEYVTEVFVNKAIIADVNIHLDNQNNPHAHIMLTTRQLTQNEKGEWVFGNKNRLLDTRSWLKDIREEWAQINNQYFELYDIDKSITAESYETRGLGFLNTTIHEGAATHSENASIRVLDRTEYNRNVVFENLQFIKSNPTQVIMAVIKDKSKAATVFNKENILNAIESFLDEIAVRDISHSVLISEIKTILEDECDSLIERCRSSAVENVLVDGSEFNIGKELKYATTQNATEYFKNLFQGIRQEYIQNQKSFSIDDELEYIKSNRDKIIGSLNSQRAIFSKADIAKLLDDYINKNILSEIDDKNINNKNLEVSFIDEAKEKIAKEYSNLLLNFMSSDELVKLADKDLSGNEVYTTKSQIQLEKEFLSCIDDLNSQSNHKIELHEQTLDSSILNNSRNILSAKLANILPSDGKKLLEKVASSLLGKQQSHILTIEQEEAVKKILNSNDIVALSGMPGTGKSTVMERVAQEYKDKGYEVYGASLAAVAALSLGQEAGITSHTLSKWKYDWDLRADLEAKGETVRNLLPTLTNKTVFIVDEMSMVDLKLANFITNKVKDAGAKLICIFDNNQFSAIGTGGASDKIAEAVENVSLTELFRQRTNLDKDITKKLSNYKVDEVIKILDNEGRIKFGNNATIVKQELVEQYLNKRYLNSSSDESASVAIIAYKNKEVSALNLQVRERLLSAGLLYTRNYDGKDNNGQEFVGSKGKMAIAIDERIVFTKNHKRLGVLNGQLGKVVEIIDERSFKVELLSEKGKHSNFRSSNNMVVINNDQFTHFDYGYAITAHKSQGKTYDYSYVLLDSSVGYEAFNVMASRHRQNSEFYIDKGCLNDIISRKFDKHSESKINLSRSINQYNDVEGATNNQKSALYEMLVKRVPRSFAHDFIDYETRKEVIQIREYLESRDAAAAVYRELLDWQSRERSANNNGNNIDSNNENSNKAPNLWDKEELWNKFIEFTSNRKAAAEEILENYLLYQKYIDPSLVNYATLVKHAGKSSLSFDYQESNNEQLDNQQSTINYARYVSKEVAQEYAEVVKLADVLLENYNPKLAKKLIAKSEGLIATHQEHQLNLERVANKITSLENEKWLLESQKNACEYYQKDFSNFLNETYKQGSEKALGNWSQIVKQHGTKQALANVVKEPELLGNIAGMGIGQKLAISDKRAIALFNLKTLATRLEKYESSTEQEKQLEIQIKHIETNKLAELKKQYNNLSQTLYLGHNQEKYLENIINNKHNLKTIIFKPQEKEVSTSNRDYSKVDHLITRLSYAELHDKLSANTVELASELLPNISNKPIEITKNSIKCGSINISLDSKTKGLWCRFSRENEKGDLFDLIKISKGLSSKHEAMNWSKSYLGIETTKIPNLGASIQNLAQENNNAIKNDDSLKTLIPAPSDALVFNPEKLFMYKLKSGNKVIESVYTYKNLQNELCGYVVRIKDLENDKKETLPVVYTENSKGIRGWKSRGFGENRCLYNEQSLANSNKPVLIVEGEKTADAAKALYPEFNVVSWSGGVNAVNKSNWSSLQGKEVIIWPDNDKAGIDAAGRIQELLAKQNITKAQVVALEKIDYLPIKWDLADELPEDVRQHQITGALFSSNGIASDIRIEKTLNHYIENRFNSLHAKLLEKNIDTFDSYMIEKEKIKYQLHYEVVLLKDALQTKNILSVRDEFEINSKASNLVDQNIKSFHLHPAATEDTIIDCIKHDLEQLHHRIPQDLIKQTTSIVFAHVERIINKDNQLSANKTDSYFNTDSTFEKHIFTKSSIPVLVLSLASSMLSHYENVNSSISGQSENIPHDNDQLKLHHLININENIFKSHIEKNLCHFQQHQQQMTQSQMMRNNTMEI